MKPLRTVIRPLLALACCAGWLAAQTVRVNGTGAALEMLKTLVQAYRKANPAAAVEVGRALGSSGALKALGAGALDLAVISSPATPKEAIQYREYGRTPLAIATGIHVGRTDIS